jgi:hypothetical protein
VPVRSTLVITTTAIAAAALSAGLLGAAPAGAGPAPSGAPSVTAPAPVAPRAPVATTLGSTGGVPAICTGTPSVPAATLLATEGAGAPSYIAAKDGVLVSFTHVAGNSFTQVRAIVFANTTTDGHKLVAAKSPLVTMRPAAVNTVSIRLPIKAGQRLGLGYTSKQTVCLNVGVAGDSASFASPFNADTTSDYFTSGSFTDAYRPNISAVFEPDKDGDGFGDVSQDACPKSALSQVACPKPNTHIKKRVRLLNRHRVKLKFVSTIAGSTFECSLDGRKFRTCPTPYKKRFPVGEHELRVRSVSPAGITDHKPAKVTFRIR